MQRMPRIHGRNNMVNEKKKQEVELARKELKEKGFYNYFITPLTHYWKEQPLVAFTNFLMWIMISYTIFTGIQAINYDLIYCESSNSQYNGKILQVYNDYVTWVNENSYDPKNPWKIRDITAQTSTINCNYDIEKWKKETTKNKITSIFQGWVKIALKQ